MTGTGTAWADRPRTSAAETTSVRGRLPLMPAKEHQRANRQPPADAAKDGNNPNTSTNFHIKKKEKRFYI